MNFPVLILVEGDPMIYVYENDYPFRHSTIEIYKNLVYSKHLYIDSTGKKFRIKSVKKIGYSGLWGFSLLYKGRQIKILTEFEDSGEIYELDKLKEILKEKIKKKKNIWLSSYESIEELSNLIIKADNYNELFKLFW